MTFAAAAATMALASALLPGTASAATTGTLSFSPASGTANSLIRVTTSGGCPSNSDAFTVSITGAAFTATSPNINGYAPLSSVGSSGGATSGFAVDLSNTIAIVAQDNGVTLTAGTYSISVNCLLNDPLNPVVVSDMTSSLVFTDATHYVTSVPTTSTKPSLSGAVKVGSTVTCNPGTWAGATSYTYEFLKNGVVVQTSTTDKNVVLALGDLGKAVACRVTATNAVGTSAAVTSSAATVTVGVAPKASAKPKITVKGKKLKASTGTWSPKASYAYSYTWKRGSKVVGTKATYKTVKADKGKKIAVTVKAARSGYATGSATSKKVTV